MRKIENVLSTYNCPRCKNELLTSVTGIPNGNILYIQYSKYCKLHGTVISATEEETMAGEIERVI